MEQQKTSLHEFLDKQEEVEQEGFTIQDDQQANWALRKVRQFQQQQKENNALAESEIEKIQEWNDQENTKAQHSIDYFQGLLARYAMDKRKDDPKFKTLKLPNGKIRFAKQQPKFNYNDDEIIDALKQSNRTDLINTKETPNKAEIKKRFEVNGNSLVDPETGEIIPGVSVEHRDEKFSVEVDEE